MKLDHEAMRAAAAAADDVMAEDMVIDPATGFMVITEKWKRWLRIVEELGLIERVWTEQPSGQGAFTLQLTDEALARLRTRGSA
jgi:hypothetical protein